MSLPVDVIVSSLPALAFGAPPPLTAERFADACGGSPPPPPPAWTDLETQLRNAMAEARAGDARFARPARGCSRFWRDRVAACFQEKDVARRDEMLDRVWWDAAGELTDPASPLGTGALATYAVRLGIARRRAAISAEKGAAAFDRLVAQSGEEGT